MKTIYLVKSFLPFLFLPIAPSVLQAELVRQGVVAPAGAQILSVVLQIVFTLGVIGWLAYSLNRKNQAKAFLKMSCRSKKVFHQNEWMSVEQYLHTCHNIVVSHGLTPDECEDWVRESEQYLGTELPALRLKIRKTTEAQAA